MHYIVTLEYDDYEFVNPQEAFDFASIAKESAIGKARVSIAVMNDEEYAKEYCEKESEN